MHPSKFFEECVIKDNTLNIEERDELKNNLKNIHPKNILASEVSLYVVKLEIEHTTIKGNIKYSGKYIVLPLNENGLDSLELQAKILSESYIDKYNLLNRDNPINHYEIMNLEILTKIALPIG